MKKNGEWLPLSLVKKNYLSLPVFDFIPAHKRADFCDQVLHEFIRKYPLNEKNEMLEWLPVVVIVLKK